MTIATKRAVLALAVLAVGASAALAQTRPYTGYVYPAGGQRGTTFLVKLGGQNLDGPEGVVITGKGVKGKVVELYRKLGPQEITLLNEQLDELKKKVSDKNWNLLKQATEGSDAMMGSEIGMISPEMMSQLNAGGHGQSGPAIQIDNLGIDPTIVSIVTKIRTRMSEYVLRPASAAIASLLIAEITIAPDAETGQRELRVVTQNGVSNPLVFYVGQPQEYSRIPMLTSEVQVLGKEALALRRRRENEGERRVTVPCTVNGQIASAEVHRYRFSARKGQKLVISTAARELIPFIADAVPGWFQPVLTIYDSKGKEVAYNDDFRFDPDPLILFDPPKDGDYVLAITDAIFRGREDFVYRVTIDQSLLITNVFPLGMQIGTKPTIDMKGANLEGARLGLPKEDANPGVHYIRAYKGGQESNSIPFAVDTLPECLDQEANNDVAHAQKVELPIIINGRIDRPDDWDVFQFTGHAGETIVAEVKARRLNSPLDSVLKITDARGNPLGVNDDHDAPEVGANTHSADSYLTVKLPETGTYYIHLGDTARSGGEEYAYRLRLSGPWPDFSLRVMPSSVFLRRDGSATVSVFVGRKDGFSDPIRIELKNPPEGISSNTAHVNGDELVTKLTIRANGDIKPGLVDLVVQGTSGTGADEMTREAVACEDRMQAFLWRHLVPAKDFVAMIPDPVKAKARKPRDLSSINIPIDRATGKPRFSKQEVTGRLRQLDLLFGDGLLTKEFYRDRIAECGATP